MSEHSPSMELSAWHMWWKRGGAAGVRRILMQDWDPIHVDSVPEAADEYDTYVGAVGRMLREGATDKELARYLTDISENHMGLGLSPAGREVESAVAAHLVKWYDAEMRPAD